MPDVTAPSDEPKSNGVATDEPIHGVVYKTNFVDNGGAIIDTAVPKKKFKLTQRAAYPEDPVIEVITTVNVTVTKNPSSSSSDGKKDAKTSTGADTSSSSDKKENGQTKEPATTPETNGKKNGGKKEDEKDESKTQNFIERSIETVEMKIHSQHLLKTLRYFVDYYPSQSLVGDTVTVKEPYHIIVHYQEELEKFRDSFNKGNFHGNKPAADENHLTNTLFCDRITYDHLGILFEYIERFHGNVREERARHQKQKPVCTFEMLWMLFRPGEDVYTNDPDGRRAGYIVHSCEFRDRGDRRQAVPLDIHLWYLDYDGRIVGRCMYKITIQPFDGEREITTLRVFPCRYFDNEDNNRLRQSLEARGERFFKVLKPTPMKYCGDSLGKQRRWAST